MFRESAVDSLHCNRCDRSIMMALQRRRKSNPLIFCCLAAFALVLCGRSKRWTTASADETKTETETSSKGKNKHGGLQMPNFFSSLFDDSVKKALASDLSPDNDIELSEGELSELVEQFQQAGNHGPPQIKDLSYNENNPRKDSRSRGKSNRRKVLYDLSVQAHYERLLHEQETKNISSSADNNESDNNATTTSCEYYNDGMHAAFNLRKMAAEESIFSRCSHWTFKLCPKQSISQLHLKPATLTEGGDDDDAPASSTTSQSLKLHPNSVLSDSIQFDVPTIHGLGFYVSPHTSNYKSLINDAWGPGETNAAIPKNSNLVEYYVGGDVCRGTVADHDVTKKRQSKVIYETECCERRQSMMEEFFQNDGEIMIRSTTEAEPCRYVIYACNICHDEEVGGEESLEEDDDSETSDSETAPSVDPYDFGHLLQTYLQYPSPTSSDGGAFPPMPPSQIEANKQLLQTMFTHSYDSYFYNAFPASELKPLTCQPGVFNLVKVPALTLIDLLDTLMIMGNYTEFARSVERLRYLDDRMKGEFQSSREKKKKSKDNNREGEEGGLFSLNQNVSVFETTIRVLGGLLSAHQMAIAFMKNLVSKSDVWDSSGEILSGNSTVGNIGSGRKKDAGDAGSFVGVHGDSSDEVNIDGGSCSWEPTPCPTAEPGVMDEEGEINSAWEYDGFLLELAHDIGKRLLTAFDTDTGIPYGTVNLLNGIPPGETPDASLAGAGTLSLEFELLSRLTGDQSFGKAAKLAARALWIRRSPKLDLVGKHINTENGSWREHLSGIGSNSDSFYEYLIKHYLLFPDDTDFWTMFLAVYSGVHDNARLGEWYVDVDMNHGLNGHVRQVFESLMAFYPGLQVLLGEVVPAAKTLNSFFLVREFVGLLPERFNFAHWKSEGSGNVHPLRPELLESCYFLHLASIGLHGTGPCSNAGSTPQTSSWLWAADFALHAVHKLSWTPCGFATVANVGPTTTGGLDLVGNNHDPQTEQRRLNIQHKNEMPSYFLSETIKYLYLTFDAENSILHRDTERDWVFTTEAHPIHYAPVFNSTTNSDDRLNTQLDQVRSLLKQSISNSMDGSSHNTRNDEIDEALSVNVSDAGNLEHEQWSSRTLESIFVENLHNVESELIASKHWPETNGIHFFKSGPPMKSSFLPAGMEPQGIFTVEFSDTNQAHVQFGSNGKGSGYGLGKRCPNYHHPDLQWTHALNGASLDYNMAHLSSVSNEAWNHDEVDERMNTALASVSFYGTDFYADGMHVDTSKSCRIEEAPEYSISSKSKNNVKNDKLRSSIGAPVPGATRYDMGGEIGTFDVSAFPGGDGFVVKHIDSNELLEVSIFHNNPESLDAGTVILVVLTVPAQNPSQLHPTGKDSTSSILSRRSSGVRWRRRSSVDTVNGDPSEENEGPGPIDDDYRRHVVVADLETNSFKCQVVLNKKGKPGDGENPMSFPCSPAFFGKANMPNLIESGGEIIMGVLSPPPPGDELGCNLPEGANLSLDEGRESNVLQMVRRGDCNFMRKAANHAEAGGIIVINSNPHELFVMAGEKTPTESNISDDDLPVSVLVSGEDGESIIQLLNEEGENGNEVGATILLTSSDEVVRFPYVKGSQEALQILATNGWGIHAVPQTTNTQQDGWQLFITQHNKKA